MFVMSNDTNSSINFLNHTIMKTPNMNSYFRTALLLFSSYLVVLLVVVTLYK